MSASNQLVHQALTAQIIKGFFEVYNELGFGFLESAYQNALPIALRELNLHCQREVSLPVKFRGITVCEYRADLIVNKHVIVETKAATKIHPIHELQLLSYLKATNLEVGLLLNFGPKPEFKRLVNSN